MLQLGSFSDEEEIEKEFEEQDGAVNESEIMPRVCELQYGRIVQAPSYDGSCYPNS